MTKNPKTATSLDTKFLAANAKKQSCFLPTPFLRLFTRLPESTVSERGFSHIVWKPAGWLEKMRWVGYAAVIALHVICIMKRTSASLQPAPRSAMPAWMVGTKATHTAPDNEGESEDESFYDAEQGDDDYLVNSSDDDCEHPIQAMICATAAEGPDTTLNELMNRPGGVEALSREEETTLIKLLKKLETPGHGDTRRVVLRGANGKDVSYVCIPGCSKAADRVGSNTIRKRASFVESICEMVGWGACALARLLARNKPQSEAAIAGANLSTSMLTLSKEQTMLMMGKMKLSWTMLSMFRRLLASWGAPLAVTSNAILHAEVQQYLCATEFRTLELDWKDKKTVLCQVSTSSLFDVVIQDAEQARKNGTFVSANLVTNRERLPRGSWVMSQDTGNRESKFTLHSIDREHPCSVANQKRFATCETLRADDPRKADEHAGNFRKIVETVDGLHDLDESVLVSVELSYTIVPAHIIPTVWSCTRIEGNE